MASSLFDQTELLDRIGDLRRDGRAPKQIAHLLGLRPAQVAPLIRAAAAREAAAAGPAALVGCWISPGWATGLTMSGRPEWRALCGTDQAMGGTGGMATVVVARRHKPSQVSLCGYLIDTHCLGVKNAHGPQIQPERQLPEFLDLFFAPFEHLGPPIEAPLELARHLLYGAVDAARRLGFEPHPDFAAAADHLGSWDEQSAITFGHNGRPSYVSGPYDDVDAVLRTLNQTVGAGNFDISIGMDLAAIG